MTDSERSPWLTRAEAAVRARASVQTIDRWRLDGRLPAYKVAGIKSVRYRVEDLDALMQPADGG